MKLSELLAQQLDGSRDWTRKLIADLAGDDWLYQPSPGQGHALWICGHLATAQDTLIHVRCLGKSVLDETFRGHFPLGSPVKSGAAHAYPDTAAVLATMDRMHTETLARVRTMSDELLAEAASGKGGKPHPHYTTKMGAVSHCGRHEAFHAGQIATIRGMLGKTFLR